MRILWTLLKVAVALAIAIPLGIVALGLFFGIVGVVFGLAIAALKLACLGLVAYGVYRVARFFFAGSSPAPAAPVIRELPQRDPYYDAAMRELNAELGRDGSH